MTKTIDDSYEIKLKINEEIFTYKSLKKENIVLFGHCELPQYIIYSKPQITNDGKYIYAVAEKKEENFVYVWEVSKLNAEMPLMIKTSDKIEGLTFFAHNTKIVIVYKTNPIEVYDLESKKFTIKGQKGKIKEKKIISFCISEKENYFGVSSDKDFTVYRLSSGNITKQLMSSSPVKVIRNKYIYLIGEEGFVQVYNIENCTKHNSFNIKGNNDMKGIIESIISPDNDQIFYLKNDGIYKINITSKESSKLADVSNIIKGAFSEDCTICMTTDMKVFHFWGINNTNVKIIGSIYKENFKCFSINFPQSKLLVCEDNSIAITDIMDSKATEMHIWLDLNPEKFESVFFSPDYLVVLCIIDEHNAISYNTFSGEVIKKWKNNLEEWSQACLMVPSTAKMGVIVTKEDNKTIKIWDYLTGTDLATFSGFNTYSFGFNKYGNLLAAGSMEGEEICRVINLEDGQFKSFIYKGQNNNKKTRVCLTKHSNIQVIAMSECQNPVIFDYKTQQLILEYEEFPAEFNKIIKIECNSKNTCFYVIGKDNHDVTTAVLMESNKGNFICEYNNCRNIEFSRNHKYLLSDSDNRNPKYLCITNLIDLEKLNVIDCEDVLGKYSTFLADNKTISSLVINEADDNLFTYILTDVESGKTLAEVEVKKNTDKYSITNLSVNKKGNYILFRYLELHNPKK